MGLWEVQMITGKYNKRWQKKIYYKNLGRVKKKKKKKGKKTSKFNRILEGSEKRLY